jgi:hypothetical protein
LLEYYTSPEQTYLSLVDPESGLTLCNRRSIPLGTQITHTISQDLHTLAVASISEENSNQVRLIIVDLMRWMLTEPEILYPGWINMMTFDKTGRYLVLAYADPVSEYPAWIFNRYMLNIIDLAKNKVIAEKVVDTNPTRAAFTSDGARIMVYGTKLDKDSEYANNVAHVLLMDSITLDTVWESDIPGILDGQFRIKDGEDPDSFEYWMPAVVFSQRDQLLYILHAEDMSMTMVDFSNKTFQTSTIERRRSWVERILTSLSDTAHAKILADGIRKSAILSQDGKRLYATGVITDNWQDNYGNWQSTDESLGFQVIDLETGIEIATIKTSPTEIAPEIVLSPDGNRIYLRGWTNGYWTEVLDSDSFERIGLLEGGKYLLPARRLDGTPILVGSNYINPSDLAIYNQATGEEILSWRINGYVTWLVAP